MSKAILRFIRLSPTKARLIAREVQGMNAEEALAALEFMPNKAAKVIAKVITSAVANGGYEPEEVEIVPMDLELHKPLDFDEAIEALKAEKKRQFIVFNDHDGLMRVMYKRADGKFGLY